VLIYEMLQCCSSFVRSWDVVMKQVGGQWFLCWSR